MKPPKSIEAFEYGGLWLHASEEHSKEWRKKLDGLLYPPIDDFHLQLLILRATFQEEKKP